MRLDQFTKGQTAYILGDGNTVISKKEPVEVTVSKIGRKYVTVTTSGRWEIQFEETFIEDFPYLREKTECGAPRMLFPSSIAAAEYLEREDLKRWVQQAVGWDKIGRYTLEQFRDVKRILEGGRCGLKR